MTYRFAPRLALALLLATAACGSSSSTTTTKNDAATGGTGGTGGSSGTGGTGGSGGSAGADAGPAGGPVMPGENNMHCKGKEVIKASEASCNLGPPDGGGDEDDGGAEPEPAVNKGSEADDDDCKYHMSWTSDPIRQNVPVYFTAKAVTIDTKQAVPWHVAPIADEASLEVVLGDSHLPKGMQADPVEGPTGTVKFGPVIFDQAGDWLIRFHIREKCKDIAEDSPHSHAAFLVHVP